MSKDKNEDQDRDRDQGNESNNYKYTYTYMYTILFIIGMFILLVLGVMYLLDSKKLGQTHYKGNCLLDLVTTYHTKGCLDN